MENEKVKTNLGGLLIDNICRKKMQYWANAAKGEVSGLGMVEKTEEGHYIVKEVFILEQECSGTNTELDPTAIAELMEDLTNRGKNIEKLKYWWHSHVDMGVFWSGTDDECIETLSREFSFSTVVNKKGESKTRADIYNPFRVIVDDLRLIEVSEEDKELKEQCKKEVEEKVNSKGIQVWDASTMGWQAKKGYYDQKEDDNYEKAYKNFLKKKQTEGKELDEETRNDIISLDEFMEDHGHTKETIASFSYELCQNAAKEIYKNKAECKDGIGTFVISDKLCKKCAISKNCSQITELLNKNIYFDINSISEEDLDIVLSEK